MNKTNQTELLYLTTSFDDFKSEIEKFVIEGITLHEYETKNEDQLTELKTKIKEWENKVLAFLKTAFTDMNNYWQREFYQTGARAYKIPGMQVNLQQEIKNQKDTILNKNLYLEFNLKLLSISDAIISPDKINLEERKNYNTNEKLSLLLDKLYDIYDDYSYPVKSILNGNGVPLKRSNEEYELAKTLEDRGWLDIHNFGELRVQLTAEGALFVEEQRKKQHQSNTQNKEMSNKTASGKIFISHSNKDKVLVQKFIDHVLMLGLGIKREEIFCTSLDGMGIKSGEDFKKAIYTELEGAKAVFQIITKNYKSSEVCLNEMGAAWLMKSTVIPLVAPPFNYDIGFIHASTQQLRLQEKNDLLKLYDDHKNEIFTSNVSVSNYLSQVDIFLEYLSTYSQNEDIKKETMFFYGEESTISGKLKSGIFGHPPAENFEDSASYHRYFFIIPKKPINVLSSELFIEEGNADITYFNLERIHISPLEEIDLKKLEDKDVAVTGTFMGGHTAWHRTEVVMRFSDIQTIN